MSYLLCSLCVVFTFAWILYLYHSSLFHPYPDIHPKFRWYPVMLLIENIIFNRAASLYILNMIGFRRGFVGVFYNMKFSQQKFIMTTTLLLFRWGVLLMCVFILLRAVILWSSSYLKSWARFKHLGKSTVLYAQSLGLWRWRPAPKVSMSQFPSCGWLQYTS